MLLNRRRVRCAALSRSCSTGSFTSGVRLAEAILSVATEGNTDVEDLKNRVNRGAGQDNRPERDAGVTAAGKLLTAFEQSPFLVGFTPRQRLDLRPIATRTGAVRCSAELLTIPSRPRCSATRSSAWPSSNGSDSETAGGRNAPTGPAGAPGASPAAADEDRGC